MPTRSPLRTPKRSEPPIAATWSWSPIAWDAAVSWPNHIHNVSPTRTLAFGDPRDGEFEIYVTDNGGDTWSRIPGSALPDPLMDEYGSSWTGDGWGNHLWFGTLAGRVFHSSDAGNSWEAFQTPLPYLLGLNFSDTLHGVAFTQLDAVTHVTVHTSDGGRTWTDITPTGVNRILGMERHPQRSLHPDRRDQWRGAKAGRLALGSALTGATRGNK